MIRHGETGDWIGTFIGHKGAVWSAHLNSNATKAATASADYTAKIWDSLTGEELQSLNHGRIVKVSQFSNDDQRLLTGGQDKILRIFDLSKPDAEPLKMEGHTQSIKVALWCKDGNTIISAAQEPGLRIWDARTLSQINMQPTKAPITGLEISLDGKHLTTTSGKEVTFWNSTTFEPIKTFTLSMDPTSAALAPDCSSFAVGGTDHWVRVYDFNTGKEIEVHKGHHGPVHCVRYSPDGAMFASGSEDGTVRLWQNGEIRAYGLWQDAGNHDSKAT